MRREIYIGIKYGIINFTFNFLGFIIASVSGLIRYLPSAPLPTMDLGLFLFVIVIAPLLEEFFFRLIPITSVKALTDSRLVLYSAIIISSVVFGYIHGSWQNIFMQGISGLILSLAFLKGGYVSSVIAHGLNNALISGLIYLFLVLWPRLFA